MKRAQFWLRVVLVAAGVVLAVTLLGLWMLNSEPFARWALNLVESGSDGQVRIGNVSGSFSGSLELDSIELLLDEASVSLGAVTVALDLRGLIARSLVIDELRIGALTYQSATRAEQSQPSGDRSVPILVLIRSLVIAESNYVTAETTFTVTDAAFELRLLNNRLEINDFSAAYEGLRLRGNGALILTDVVAVESELCAVGVYLDEPVSGCAQTSGLLSDLDVAARFEAPFDVDVAGSLQLDNQQTANLNISWRQARLRSVAEVGSSIGQIELTGPLNRLRLEGSGAVEYIDESLQFGLTARLEPDIISLDSLRLTRGELAARFSGEMSADFSRAAVEVSLANFDPGLFFPGWDGDLQLRGNALLSSLDPLQVSVDDLVVGGTLRDVPLAATGSFAYDTENSLRAAAEVSATNFDPGLFFPGWDGDLQLRGNALLSSLEPLQVSVGDLVMGGTLQDRPLAVTGGFVYNTDRLLIEQLRAVSRQDSLEISGSYGEAIDLSIQASVSDLAIAAPDLKGSLVGNLAIGGSRESPRVEGALDIQALEYGDNIAAAINVSGNVGLALTDTFTLQASIDGLNGGGVEADRIEFSVIGTAGQHELEISAQSDQWQLSGTAAGGLRDSQWDGMLTQLNIAPAEFDEWSLVSASELSVANNLLRVPKACLAREISQVCLELEFLGTPEDRIQIDANQFDVRLLTPFFPPGVVARGLFDAHGEFEGLSGSLRGALAANAQNAGVEFDLGDGALLDVPIDDIAANAVFDGGHTSITANLESQSIGTASVFFETDDVREAASPVAGMIEARWNDVSPMSLLSPDVDTVGGAIDLLFDLGGTLDAPTAEGRANWRNGLITVPAWGLSVEQIEAEVVAGNSQSALFNAIGYVGGAALNLEGEIAIDPERNWPMRLSLSGVDVPLVQLPDVEIYVSPDLQVDVQLPAVVVTGTVDVPRALISSVELPEQAATPSADTIIHGREDDPPRPLNVSARLAVNLGDDVRYEAIDLLSRVTGSLDVSYTSGLGASATGDLTVSGNYNAYGNPLELERGQLIFVGPWDNPSLDIRAVRRISEITVGVQLNGTLSVPQTTIFSEPAMNETDALSYLLFGRPIETASGGDSSVLQSAAISMGLRQALPAIERIGDTLRLDDFTIRNTDTDAGALMAGKYLSPNLYLRYSYGLFNRIGGLLLRYRITDRLSIETQSGDQKSMDLLYTVEKN